MGNSKIPSSSILSFVKTQEVDLYRLSGYLVFIFVYLGNDLSLPISFVQ